jgi:hypothetical protein
MRHRTNQIVLFLLALALGACQLVAGLEQRDVDPKYTTPGTAGTGGSAGSAGNAGESGQAGGAAVDCQLSHDGNAWLRLGNLKPSPDPINFCIRPHMGEYTSLSIWKEGGANCPESLAYRKVWAPVGKSAGTYDIKVVDATATNCQADALAELQNLELVANQVISVMYMPVGNSLELRAFPETTDSGSTFMRFVHALQTEELLELGVTSSPNLPTSLLQTIFSKVEPGQTTKAGTSPQGSTIDSLGYTKGFGKISKPIGLQRIGTNQVQRATIPPPTDLTQPTISIFGIGTLSEPKFPIDILVCKESIPENSLYSDCNSGVPSEISVEVFSPALRGSFTPGFEAARLPAVIAALQNSPVDILCLREVFALSNKQMVIDQLKSTFPFSASITVDENTPVDDPTDQLGNIPPTPTSAPCASPSIVAKLSPLLDCVTAHCSSIPGDGAGFATNASCMQQWCIQEIVEAQAIENSELCSVCFAGALGSVPLKDIGKVCSEQSKLGLAYSGNDGGLLLSKLPLGDVSYSVLPSNLFRRAPMRVPVTLPTGQEILAYCGDFSRIISNFGIPYPGPYGNGLNGPDGWAAEQELQVGKYITFAKNNSANRVAIHLLQAQAGPEYKENGNVVLNPFAIESFHLLTQAFQLVQAPNFVPSCTSCKSNSLLGGNDSWITHIFAENAPTLEVLNSMVTYQEPVVDVEMEENGSKKTVKIPISSEFGYRSTLRIYP